MLEKLELPELNELLRELSEDEEVDELLESKLDELSELSEPPKELSDVEKFEELLESEEMELELSKRQVALQPSPLLVFPSSHCSGGSSKVLFPQSLPALMELLELDQPLESDELKDDHEEEDQNELLPEVEVPPSLLRAALNQSARLSGS